MQRKQYHKTSKIIQVYTLWNIRNRDPRFSDVKYRMKSLNVPYIQYQNTQKEKIILWHHTLITIQPCHDSTAFCIGNPSVQNVKDLLALCVFAGKQCSPTFKLLELLIPSQTLSSQNY